MMTLLTVALVILVILAIFFSEENGGMSALAIFVATAMTWFTFGPATVMEFIKGNAVNLIIFALAYSVVGFLFAILKWILHVRKVKAQFDVLRAEFKVVRMMI